MSFEDTNSRYFFDVINISIDILAFLLDNGEEDMINLKNERTGQTVIYTAIKDCNYYILEFLLLNNAKLDVKNNNNQTPLLFCYLEMNNAVNKNFGPNKYSYLKIMALLIKYGKNYRETIMLRDNYGKNILDYESEFTREKTLEDYFNQIASYDKREFNNHIKQLGEKENEESRIRRQKQKNAVFSKTRGGGGKKEINLFKKLELTKLAKIHDISLKTRENKMKTKKQLFNSLKRKKII